MIRSRTTKRTSSQAFTLVELIVSITIFGIMTALVVAKYGTFNNSVLLTNAAYDVAGAIRTAQTYGLSVKGTGATPGSFDTASYGIDFVTKNILDNTKTGFILFADTHTGPGELMLNYYDAEDLAINKYILKQGAFISNICSGTGPNSCYIALDKIDVTFRRPDPEAIICVLKEGGFYESCDIIYGQITLQATDGSTRKISVYKNGQVSVEN